MYDFANSAYQNSMALWLPLLANTMARIAATGDNAVRDCVRNCEDGVCEPQEGATVCRACVVGEGRKLWTNATQELSKFESSTVSFFGERESVSFALFVISISVLFQALVMVTFGAWADYYDYRKKGLAVTTAVGGILCMGFLALTDPSMYLAAAWLTIFSNGAFGLSVVYYNAFLPILVSEHPEVAGAPPQRLDATAREISDYMSNVGYAAGYLGSLINVLIAIVMMLLIGSRQDSDSLASPMNNLAERIGIFWCGLWWAVFSLWTFRFLKPHSGKTLGEGEWLWTKGWTSTASTLAAARAYPQTFKFFVAYFLYSDSYSTMASVGILIFSELLCMPTFTLALVYIEVMIFAIVGNFLALYLQRRWGSSTKHMILYCLAIYVAMTAWGMLGMIPASPVGLKQGWEAYAFGAVHGLLIGPVQSYSRSLYADLLIPGQEAEFYALYEISDKSSSWIGPMVVAEIIRLTGNYRLGFLYLFFMLLVPAALLSRVDRDKGRAEVLAMAPKTGTPEENQSLPYPPTVAGAVPVAFAGVPMVAVGTVSPHAP